jgi:hypothetical protein
MGWDIVFWHWLAFGAFLLIVELLAPGVFFLWMAQAAAITGVLLFFLPSLGWEAQIAVFSVLSVLSVALARRFVKRHPIASDQPLLNRRTAHYIGRVFTLDRPIINGQGKLKIDDSLWKIRGEDCEAGTQVKVVDADSVVLVVRKANKD